MKFSKYLASINLLKKLDRWIRPPSSASESRSSPVRRIGVFHKRKIIKIGRVFDRRQQSKSREIRQSWKWLQRFVTGLAALIFALIPSVAYGNITMGMTPLPATILSTLTGSNVTISNLVTKQGTIGGVGKSIATFSGGLTGGAGSNIGIATGVALVTGDASFAPGANRYISRSSATTAGAVSDADLTLVESGTQKDTTSITIDVVPQGNFLSVKFVFASEEYNEFVCSIYNDAMGVFVSGLGTTGNQNIAKVGTGLLPLAVNQVNNGSDGSYTTSNPTSRTTGVCTKTNTAFFVNNISQSETAYSANTATNATTQSSFTNLEYDGFTIPIEAQIAVTPGQTYKVKIAVADIGDASWDSAVFVEKISSFNLDLGDAPDTYLTSVVNGSVLLPGAARHSTGASATLYLGATGPDPENITTPATTGSIANNDDIIGSDDEDALSGNDLFILSGITSYSIPTIPVHNGLASTAKLMGWIDFNKNGLFDGTELATANVPTNATTASLSWSGFTAPTAGTSYARFRITTDPNLIATPSPAGLAIDGEVEDYRVKFDTRANLGAKVLLVKRITGIKPVGSSTWFRTANPNEPAATATRLDTVVHNPLDTANNDTNSKWPAATYLVGAYNAGKIKPGDELEYTIYYLNAQGADATSLKICDPIRGKQTYTTGSMQLLPGGSSISLPLTDVVDPNIDRANSYGAAALPTVVTAPIDCNTGSIGASLLTARDNGGVAVQITGTSASGIQPTLTAIPGATANGVPNTSYGWFRFTTKVDP
jgi:hypothetical protein